MTTSMISTVLEIEREAEELLAKAKLDAERIIKDAKAKREDASKAFAERIGREVADIEARAADEKAKKVRELTAAGEAALAVVRNVSDAAYDGGVRHLMKALTNG